MLTSLRALALVLLLATLTIACGDTDTPSIEPPPAPDRLALLEDAAMLLGNTVAEKDWATLYLSYPQDFRAKCPAPDFLQMWVFIEVFGEMPDGLTFTLHRVWIEGEYGYVDAEWVKDGVAWGFDEEGEPDPSFVWVDSAWAVYVSPEEMAKDDPCEIALDE